MVRRFSAFPPVPTVTTVAADMLSDRPGSLDDTAIFFSNFMHSAGYLVGPSSTVGPVPIADPKAAWTGTWFPSAATGSGEFGIFHVSFRSGSIGLYLTRVSGKGVVLEYDRLIKTLTTNSGGVAASGWDGKRYVAVYNNAIVFSDGATEVPLALESAESIRAAKFIGNGFVVFTKENSSQVGFATRFGLDGQAKGRLKIVSNISSTESMSALHLADGKFVLSWTNMHPSGSTKPTLSLMALNANFTNLGVTTVSVLSWPSLPPPTPSQVDYELFGYGVVSRPSGLITTLHAMTSERLSGFRRAGEIMAVRIFCP